MSKILGLEECHIRGPNASSLTELLDEVRLVVYEE